MTAAGAGSRGQVMVQAAIVLPLLLVPLVAFTLAGAEASAAALRLQAAAAQAAEDAAQQIDEGELRRAGDLRIDPALAGSTAGQALAAGAPGAALDGIDVTADRVTVRASERVALSLGSLLGIPTVVVRASAGARLVSGHQPVSGL